MRHLNIADQVIVLTREGKVREVLSGQDIQKKKTDTATSDYDVAGAEDVASAPQPSSKPRPKIKAPGPDDADLTRQTGDMAVYAYYFRSFGWPRTFGFIACTALFTFATTFQREFSRTVLDEPTRMLTVYRDLASMVDKCERRLYWKIYECLCCSGCCRYAFPLSNLLVCVVSQKEIEMKV